MRLTQVALSSPSAMALALEAASQAVPVVPVNTGGGTAAALVNSEGGPAAAPVSGEEGSAAVRNPPSALDGGAAAVSPLALAPVIDEGAAAEVGGGQAAADQGPSMLPVKEPAAASHRPTSQSTPRPTSRAEPPCQSLGDFCERMLRLLSHPEVAAPLLMPPPLLLPAPEERPGPTIPPFTLADAVAMASALLQALRDAPPAAQNPVATPEGLENPPAVQADDAEEGFTVPRRCDRA